MKKTRLYSSPIALTLAVLTLGQLGGGQILAPLPSPPSLQQNYSAPFTQTSILSLRANSRTAAVCGTLQDGSSTRAVVRLSARPFIKDGVFYLPLEDIVTILGGQFRQEDGTVTATLQDTTAVYQLGQARVVVNGQEQTMENTSFSASARSTDTAAVPLQKGEIFYIPLDFIAPLQSVAAYHEDFVILKGSFGIWLEEDYELGPYSVAELGQKLEDFPTEGLVRGELDGVLNLYGFGARRYEGDGLTLYVFEAVTEPDWNKDGDICGIRCTKRGIPTSRGLQVGDTLDWASFLYGELTDHGGGLYEVPMTGSLHLYLEAEDDVITSIGLYNRFWSPARFVEESNQQYEGLEEPQ